MPDDTQPAMLSRAQFEAGEPCPGCGLPYVDGLGSDAPDLTRTAEQQAALDAERARFNEHHADCRPSDKFPDSNLGGYRVGSFSGGRPPNLTLHCYACCPPPPLSDQQRERLRALTDLSGEGV